ncbi:T9SS type A sorting domain-containing protein [Flavobacterium sp. SM15]|uniref:DUF7619 domain-containing protein n=1 Tax=Flavobacterium sp. SM15 TaxID=2908005 RepID=UPI001EDC8E89|nr:T9SS type A sorting domain-containing protein [Flavobacterium sp. SM15]MCG2611424.1 T9SS type A sorting domain-containing protein [Flavobacterium sp. SM15]
MKKFYFLVVALCLFMGVNAQIVNIPDANFKAKLISLGVDTNSDGNIQASEALAKTNLDVSNSSISSLTGIGSFTNLTNLYCSSNQLQSLDLSGLTRLYVLECNNNLLTALDLSNSNYYLSVDCYNNQLTSLTIGQTVQTLDCHNNNLTNINFSNSQINYFDCSDNQLTSLQLGNFGLGLATLNCSNNLLTSLNVSNLVSLVNLYCSDNNITSLNLNGLNMLNNLGCSNNQLNNLNINGLTNLSSLRCSNNQLASLNLNGLIDLNSLNCDYNQLTTIDCSSLINLSTLICGNNPLVSLFVKNGRYEDFNLDNLPNLQYICADENQITALGNMLSILSYSNCVVNSYCSFVPGGNFYTILGNAKFDSNTNGNCDVSDVNLPNLKYTITNGANSAVMITNTSGNYSIPVQSGTHTITPVLENPSYFTLSPSSVNVTFPTQTSPFTQNFCSTANGIHPDLEVVLLPTNPARPGFNSNYELTYINKGNQLQSGSVSLDFDDSKMDLVAASLVPASQSVNNLTWNFAGLKPFEKRSIYFTMNINASTDIPAVNAGDVLNCTATILSAATDETPADNTFTLDQTVVNSFDPNDKTCLEGSTIAPSEVGKYVHYLIRFENTGTFPAENIVVKDIIDAAKFDVNSIVPIKGSHDYFTRINGNKVEFIFENINLPFDDANNDGYVAFKIKTKPTLTTGSSFSNSASIYFDYNFPIVTNTATTTIQALSTQDFNFEKYFTVYPNPANNVLNIETKKTIEVSSISIYNQLGQLVLVVPNAQNVAKVDVSSLSAGNYFIKINSDKGTANTKFIKQ